MKLDELNLFTVLDEFVLEQGFWTQAEFGKFSKLQNETEAEEHKENVKEKSVGQIQESHDTKRCSMCNIWSLHFKRQSVNFHDPATPDHSTAELPLWHF